MFVQRQFPTIWQKRHGRYGKYFRLRVSTEGALPRGIEHLDEKIYEEIMANNFPTLKKYMHSEQDLGITHTLV